jgi:glycosyltransferase involved in cell wall biosynthesis
MLDRPLNILFPYMARWKAVNWTRYHQLLTKLAQKGHTVHVFQPPSIDSEETNFKEIKVDIPENLHLHDFHISDFIWKKKYPFDKLVKKGFYSIIAYSAIKKAIQDYNIDVLLLYNIPQYRLSKLKSCFTIFDFADDYIAMLKHELKQYSFKYIIDYAKKIMNGMIKNVDLTIVISEELAKEVNSKSYVIPNGVCLEEAIIDIGKEYRNRFKHPIVGFIGSFEYFIDFDLIISSAERLRDFTFLLVGGGREFNKVKGMVEALKLTNITLVGPQPHSEVLKYIDIMDICLNIFKPIPISHGACPIKLFEYMAFKKPVISTRLSEVERIDNGFLYYASTVDEVISSIDMILNQKDDTINKIEMGYRLIREKYTWDKISEQFLDILKASIK